MEKDINKILEEIYVIDAELKAHEPELRQIISEIIASRPDTKFDEAFALKLRTEIIERAKALKTSRPAAVSFWPDLFKSPQFAYALGAAAVVLAIILPQVIDLKSGMRLSTGQDSSAPAAISFDFGVKKSGSAAFGPLSGLNADQGANVARSSAALGLGGGGAVAAPLAAESDASAKIGIMPPFEAVAYKYIYSGEEIKQEQAEMNVYKRLKTDAGSQALAQYVANLDFGLLDLKQFKNAKLTNFNLSEDREFGYATYLNLAENTMEIFANWEKWPRPEARCRDEKCFQEYRVKITDVPANNEIIALADKFLNDYRVDLKSYGEPVVLDSWRRLYETAANKDEYYIPEDMTVVYPLVVDGETVYDTSGNPAGLYVGVNIRFDRVANVNSIMPNSYESSAYPVLSDTAEILKLAEQGGLYPDYLPENAAKVVEVKLGTPRLVLIKYWSYENETGIGTELLVPAYIFPVTNKDEIGREVGYFYRENVVVPLPKEIVAAMATPPVGLLREPLPVEPFMAAGSGTAEVMSEDAPLTREFIAQ